MAPADPEHEHEPVRIASEVGQSDHGVLGPGQQRHRGQARQQLHPLAPPQRLDQLEAAHPKGLAEEADPRMLNRRPIPQTRALSPERNPAPSR